MKTYSRDATVDDVVVRTCRTCKRVQERASAYSRSRSAPSGFKTECKLCEAAYRAANKDLSKAANRRAYERLKSNPLLLEKERERKKLTARRAYAADPQKYRDRALAFSRTERGKIVRASYRAKEKRRLAKLARKYYWQNHDKALAIAKKWRAANRDVVVAAAALRRARLLCVTIQDVTAALLRDRAAVFGHACAYCGGPHEHWDHVIPLSRGGKHHLANLRPACSRCNLSKHAKTLAEWRAWKAT